MSRPNASAESAAPHRAAVVWRAVTAAAVVVLLSAAAAYGLRLEPVSAATGYAWSQLRGGYTVQERVDQYAGGVRARLQSRIEAAGVAYPPAQLAYVAFKDTATLQVYARNDVASAWRLVHTYPVKGMSGGPGPKLREGDQQVPEGLYRAEFLNANSRYHLSIRLDYPNAFDRAQARTEGRERLGSDIMIHGTASSIGCLAMGNQAAEDLFVLAALAGRQNVEIIVSPTDLRLRPAQIPPGAPGWLPTLYRQIAASLARFPAAAA